MNYIQLPCPYSPEFVDRITKRLLQEDFSSEAYTTTVAPPDSDSGNLSQAALEKAIESMKNLPPAPVSVWFIDREAEYLQLQRLCVPSENPADRLMGLTVHAWGSSEVEDRVRELMEVDGMTEERCRHVFPFRDAGIWVEMNNGKHYEIELTDFRGPRLRIEILLGNRK